MTLTGVKHSKWSLKKYRNAPLRPDTIMILDENENKKCYIIDSKYYSYAAFQKDESDDELDSTEDESFTVHGSIPGTDSIQKQITYAQYIDASVENKNPHHGEFRFAPENIYNVFIFPENLEEEKRENYNNIKIILIDEYNKTNSKIKGSKKSKWKLLQESEESNLTSNKNINEIKEEDENNINNIITGSYKSKFNSNKPEIENKSKRSKGSKKFKLSKKSEEPLEKEESNKKEKTETKKEEFEDDKIEGTESSSATTSSFKLTMRSNKVDLHSIKENQEVFLSSDNSKTKDKDKKSKRSKRSKKSKKKNSISQSIKEKSQEEEEDN